MRTFLKLVAAAVVIAALLLLYMYAVAIRDPLVRRVSIQMPDWPAAHAPIKIAMLSDIHVSGPDMPPARVARIVDQVNALKPDIVLLAGDFVSDKKVATRTYSAAVGLAPLKGLRATFGAWAVLGNHDHWRNAAESRRALKAANVHLLDNAAATIGPLSLGRLDDDFTGNAAVSPTVLAMRKQRGAKVLLSHSPDVSPRTPTDVTLILAGHTHCGQIRLPVIGAVSYVSNYGERFGCGLIRESSRRIIVTAGLGTSVLPLRLGAPPDIWFIELRGG